MKEKKRIIKKKIDKKEAGQWLSSKCLKMFDHFHDSKS